jgi:hypothetical protein
MAILPSPLLDFRKPVESRWIDVGNCNFVVEAAVDAKNTSSQLTGSEAVVEFRWKAVFIGLFGRSTSAVREFRRRGRLPD